MVTNHGFWPDDKWKIYLKSLEKWRGVPEYRRLNISYGGKRTLFPEKSYGVIGSVSVKYLFELTEKQRQLFAWTAYQHIHHYVEKFEGLEDG